MLTATILVCAIAELATCDRSNALDVITVVNQVTVCPGMQAQAQLASTVLGRELRPDEAIRIVCRPAH